MTSDHVLRILTLYETHKPVLSLNSQTAFITMIPQMRSMSHFSSPAEREKLMRWLGFIQGVLWKEGIFTIDELRDHIRTNGELDVHS